MNFYLSPEGVRDTKSHALTPEAQLERLRAAITAAREALEEHGTGLGALIAHGILWAIEHEGESNG
jgi:hypothetical protein